MDIYDIAKKAGVSIATVSRVVNRSNKVSEKTRVKVQKVIDEEAYIPNPFARGLGLDTMNIVGIMCPDLSDPFMANCVSYLIKELNRYGYDGVLCCSGYELKDKEKYTTILLSRHIDGLIYVGSAYVGDGEDRSYTEYLQKASAQVPVVIINGKVEGDNIFCVCAMDFKAEYDATTGLIRSGKRNILFISESHSYGANQKRAGYEAALKDNNLPVRDELKMYLPRDINSIREILLSRKDIEFDAVVATVDLLAIGALKYVLAAGKKVPEDVSIVGYDDSDMATGSSPELSSINNKQEILCHNGVECLMKAIMGEKDLLHQNNIECDIIKRNTTDF